MNPPRAFGDNRRYSGRVPRPGIPHQAAIPWAQMERASAAEVLTRDGVVLRGVIDAVSLENMLVWLHMDGGGGRRLFHASDLHSVCILWEDQDRLR